MAKKIYTSPDSTRDNDSPKSVKAEAKRILKQMVARGFAVSEEAVFHNLYCWVHGWSSGFRDESNQVFVETKTAWKGLRFECTPLREREDGINYIA